MANARRPLFIHGSYQDPERYWPIITGRVVVSAEVMRRARFPWDVLLTETRAFQHNLEDAALREFGRFDIARLQWKVTRGG